MSDDRAVLTSDDPVASPPQRWQPVMRSPINAIHQQQGAQLSLADGWEVPRRYRDVERERTAIRDTLGIADITARGKIDIRGAVGSALAGLAPLEGAIPARLSRSWVLVMTPAAALAPSLERITRAAPANAMVTDATSIYASIALLGPRVDDLLRRLISVDPSTVKPGSGLATQMLRVPAILVRRELPVSVVETYVAAELGRYVWEALFDIARPLAPEPVGWDALQAEGWH
jgi:glycine cleavage system aminomethyltransferase T